MNNKGTKAVGFIFGLMFFISGLWAVWLTTHNAFQAWFMAVNYVPAKAYVESVSLKSVRHDNATTYQTVATYRYTYHGKEYTGDRVSIHSGSDNVGSYQEDMAQKLKTAYYNQRSITIYVDPNNPVNSIIDKNLRPLLLILPACIAGPFLVIGFVLMRLSLTSGRNSWSSSRLNDNLPPDSENNSTQVSQEQSREGIKAINHRTLWIWTIFAAMFNFPTLPLLLLMPHEVRKGNYGVLFGLVFVAVGLVFLTIVVRALLEQRRFRDVKLFLQPYPSQIGEAVAGYLYVPIEKRPNQYYKVTLELMHTERKSTSEGTSNVTSSVWQRATKGNAYSTPTGSRVEFSFHIPEGMNESRSGDGLGYWWQITVKCNNRGINLNRKYEIPVVKTDSPVQPKTVSARSQPAPINRNTNHQVSVKPVRNGWQISQQPGKHGMGWLLPLVGIIFFASGVALLFVEKAPLIIGIGFTGLGGLAAVLGFTTLATGYHTFISSEQVVHQKLRRKKIVRESNWSIDRIKGLAIYPNGSSSNGKTTTEYFTFVIRDNDLNELILAHGVTGRDEALTLLNDLSDKTGIHSFGATESTHRLKHSRKT
ncbi:MAG: DUF3592 domain-containing protein [Porticoccaceae bacterium]